MMSHIYFNNQYSQPTSARSSIPAEHHGKSYAYVVGMTAHDDDEYNI